MNGHRSQEEREAEEEAEFVRVADYNFEKGRAYERDRERARCLAWVEAGEARALRDCGHAPPEVDLDWIRAGIEGGEWPEGTGDG